MNWTEEELIVRNQEVFGVNTIARLTEIGCDAPVVTDLMPEWMIEAECTRLLEQDGWRALRTDPVSDRGKGKGFGELGMADHLYIRYGRRANRYLPQGEEDQAMWIEYKSARGKPKKHQIDWHTKERARGALTLIAGVDFPASLAGFKEWYEKSGLMRRCPW